MICPNCGRTFRKVVESLVTKWEGDKTSVTKNDAFNPMCVDCLEEFELDGREEYLSLMKKSEHPHI